MPTKEKVGGSVTVFDRFEVAQTTIYRTIVLGIWKSRPEPERISSSSSLAFQQSRGPQVFQKSSLAKSTVKIVQMVFEDDQTDLLHQWQQMADRFGLGQTDDPFTIQSEFRLEEAWVIGSEVKEDEQVDSRFESSVGEEEEEEEEDIDENESKEEED
ncbi:expressed protein [Phakopsora pachyrhizi]|uniref:Expressed protein n=1 Tax=Phakopsora pachyrhizi TaxID=170000 RepID=A0AAV0AGU7_PHAPC|nr:expressed protein [Phakopsora pachyrhizi]